MYVTNSARDRSAIAVANRADFCTKPTLAKTATATSSRAAVTETAAMIGCRLHQRAARSTATDRPGGNRFILEPVGEVGGECPRGLIPSAGVFFQAFQADGLQVAGNVGVELAGAGRLVLEDLYNQHPWLTVEGDLPVNSS